MGTTCPAPYLLPLGCWDITKAAASDSTLAGLLAVIAATIIVLVLQSKKLSDEEREMRNTVLSFLVSTFLSALLTSFILGLLTGIMIPFEADVLLVLAAPALVAGALQFLLSIGWLLILYEAGKAPLIIARRAFLLVAGLSIIYLALDWADLLALKTQATQIFAILIYIGVGVFIVLLGGAIALVTRRKRKSSSKEPERRQEEPNYMQRCAKSGIFIAASSTLLFRIMSDFASFLPNWPNLVYYFGSIGVMTFMGWFVYISEMSWPTSPLPAPKESHTKVALDHKPPKETISSSPEKSPIPSGKKRPLKKSANS